MRKTLRFPFLVFILLFFTALCLPTVSLFAATQTIQNGTGNEAIRVAVHDSGMMGIWKCYETFCGETGNTDGWVRRIYSNYYGDSKHSIIFLAGDNLRFSGGLGTHLNANPVWPPAVSNTKNRDNSSITTVFLANNDVQITQTTSVRPGDNYYKMRWDIKNIGQTTYDNLRFAHGEDTWLPHNNNTSDRTNDFGEGHFDGMQQMVYITNIKYGVGDMMGLYADPATPFTRYFEGGYGDNYERMRLWTLNNTVNPANVDAGYSLGWERDSLAPGETWTIIAYEKFMQAQDVLVIAPAEQTGGSGTTVTYPFIVRNLGETPADIALSVVSGSGWQVSIYDAPASGSPISSISLPANGPTGQAIVYVRVSIPANAPAGSASQVTLTGAVGANSSSDTTTTTVSSEGVTADVMVVAPPGQVGRPGIAVKYPFIIQNFNVLAVDVSLSAASGSGWPLSVQDASGNTITSINVPGNSPATVYALVEVPANAVTGDTDQVRLFGAAGEHSVSDSAITTVIASTVIIIAPPGQSGKPGTTINYPFIVQHHNRDGEQINLGTKDSTWPVSILDAQKNSIQANSIFPLRGVQTTIYVQVEIPANAVNGTTDKVTLLGELNYANPDAGSASVTTTVSSASIAVTAPSGQTGKPGTAVDYHFTVQNFDENIPNISLSANSVNGWAVTIRGASGHPVNSISLSKGEQATVYVRVLIPENAADGNTDQVTLTGKVTGQQITSSGSTTTTVAADGGSVDPGGPTNPVDPGGPDPRLASPQNISRGNGFCGIVVGFDGNAAPGPATSAGLTAIYFAILLAPAVLLKWRRRLAGKKNRAGKPWPHGEANG